MIADEKPIIKSKDEWIQDYQENETKEETNRLDVMNYLTSKMCNELVSLKSLQKIFYQNYTGYRSSEARETSENDKGKKNKRKKNAYSLPWA